MIDSAATNWIVGLMAADIGKVVAGIIVLATLIELLSRLRQWIDAL